jgi:uncharacterized membrane protein YedE/YeeE
MGLHPVRHIRRLPSGTGLQRCQVASGSPASTVVIDGPVDPVAGLHRVAGDAWSIVPMLNSAYSPLHALAGGILIGLASLLGMVATGRVPGISGMFSRVLRPRSKEWVWRLVFFVGLLAGAAVAFYLVEAATVHRPVRSLGAVAVAGILVGFGTRLGGGCTSGHGVCGLSLGSKGSIIATLVFMAAGVGTVWLLRVAGGLFAP